MKKESFHLLEINRTPEFIQSLFPKIIWKHSDIKPLLTFDDGPNEVWTPRIVELLNKSDIKAIFFVTGEHVKESSLLRELISEGHTIGWHTQNHVSFFRSSPNQIISELEAKKYVEDLISEPIQYFRFPYGHFFPWQIKLVCSQGLTPMMWTYMLHDYKNKSESQLLKKLEHIRNNDIVLLHDNGKNCENVFKSLEKFIEEMPTFFANKINIAFSNNL